MATPAFGHLGPLGLGMGTVSGEHRLTQMSEDSTVGLQNIADLAKPIARIADLVIDALPHLVPARRQSGKIDTIPCRCLEPTAAYNLGATLHVVIRRAVLKLLHFPIQGVWANIGALVYHYEIPCRGPSVTGRTVVDRQDVAISWSIKPAALID